MLVPSVVASPAVAVPAPAHPGLTLKAVFANGVVGVVPRTAGAAYGFIAIPAVSLVLVAARRKAAALELAVPCVDPRAFELERARIAAAVVGERGGGSVSILAGAVFPLYLGA